METAAIDQSSTTVGISDGDLYGKTDAEINKTLDELQATGVDTIRVLIPWAGVEPLPGVYDWSKVDAIVNAAAARNMAVLGVVNSTPFYATQPGTLPISGAPADPSQYAAFASLAATRYVGKVSAYEIWNEPNSVQYFQTAGDAAAAYTALLKAGYTAIKAADPSATVVGGVVGSVISFGNLTIDPVTFINSIYADGGKGFFDALSFHPYQFNTPLSQQGGIPNTALTQLIAIRQLMIDNGDNSLRIWATEYGLPSAIGGEAQQAAYISDFLNTWSKLSYAGPSFIYTAQDRPAGAADPEGTFGIFRIDWTSKPAQQIIKDFIAAHTPTGPTDPPPTGTPPTDPGAALGAAVAAFYAQVFQAVVKAYLTALAQAFANIGMPQTVAAPQLLAAQADLTPVAADLVSDVATEKLATDSGTLDQVKSEVAAAADKTETPSVAVADVAPEVATPATAEVTAAAAATAVAAASAVTAAADASEVATTATDATATPEVTKSETDTATTVVEKAPTTETGVSTATPTATGTSTTGTATTGSSTSGTATTGATSDTDKSAATGKADSDGSTAPAKDGKDGTTAKDAKDAKDAEKEAKKDAKAAKDSTDAKDGTTTKDATKDRDRKFGHGQQARGDSSADASAAPAKSEAASSAKASSDSEHSASVGAGVS